MQGSKCIPIIHKHKQTQSMSCFDLMSDTMMSNEELVLKIIAGIMNMNKNMKSPQDGYNDVIRGVGCLGYCCNNVLE